MGNRNGQDPLDAALAAWRSGTNRSPKLSAASREQVLRAALDPASRPGRQASLFFPLGRVFVTAVPLVVAVAVVGLLTRDPGTVRREAPVNLRATKIGDQVVFTIANGGGTHVVRKSDSPDRFDRASGTKVRGEFSDTIDGSSPVVYYRID